jgi:hypothetical protein
VEDVTVQVAPPQAIAEFVAGLADETKKGKLARWERAICPAVIGLPVQYGQYVADRIGDAAVQVGLAVKAAPCRPDVLVLVTPEPRVAAERLVAEQQRAMAIKPKGRQLISGGGGQSAEAFIASTAPVRWWHAAETVPEDGSGVGEGNLMTSTINSRLRSNTREDFTNVLIVVDGKRLRGVSYEQLSAYLAFVALAQIKPAVSPARLDSVLTLFDDVREGRPAPETLTGWDLAYLKGLYGAPSDARDARDQQAAIAAELERGPASPR